MQARQPHESDQSPLFPQVVFSLASGNIAGAFEIITSNDSIGEVFVAKPLDREELDHYILKVSTHWLRLDCSRPLWRERTPQDTLGGQFLCCQQVIQGM